MPKITVDGKTIECKERQNILQACLDAGVQLPYYCYHPGLSIPASCRICLVEVEGIPKLVPSCQTPVRDGMTVSTKSTKAVAVGGRQGEEAQEGHGAERAAVQRPLHHVYAVRAVHARGQRHRRAVRR